MLWEKTKTTRRVMKINVERSRLIGGWGHRGRRVSRGLHWTNIINVYRYACITCCDNHKLIVINIAVHTSGPTVSCLHLVGGYLLITCPRKRIQRGCSIIATSNSNRRNDDSSPGPRKTHKKVLWAKCIRLNHVTCTAVVFSSRKKLHFKLLHQLTDFSIFEDYEIWNAMWKMWKLSAERIISVKWLS